MTIEEAASLAVRFLTGYMSDRDFFSPPDELEEPRVIPFSVQPGDAPDTLAVTFGLRPSEDADDPSAEIVAIADQCIAALRAAHPELGGHRVVVDYAH